MERDGLSATSRFGAADTPRHRHYGHFYGFEDVPDDGRPILLVHGNCQAESLRVLLEGHYGDRIHAVRLVPAHELVESDVPHLNRWLARATYLVTQPIVDGYRGLPVGTRQLLAASPGGRAVVVPVLRWTGLHPTQAIVRSTAGDPPIVPYHDLRTVVAAANGGRVPRLTATGVARLREASLAELSRRIEAHGALDVRAALTRRGRRSMYVINHPTNDVLTEIAQPIATSLGLGEPRAFDPGRILLGRIVAPADPYGAELAGVQLTADDDARIWRIDGAAVPDEEIVRAHREWYAAHPEALEAALTRHAATLRLLTGDTA